MLCGQHSRAAIATDVVAGTVELMDHGDIVCKGVCVYVATSRIK